MDNVQRIVQAGVCTGCGACDGCEHLRFEPNSWGVPTPVIDDQCTHCGSCVQACIYDPMREDD